MTDVITAHYAPDEHGDEQLRKYGEARQRAFELDRDLGLLGLGEPQVGNDRMVAAANVLKRSGIALKDATHDELLDALVEVSS